MMRLGCDIAKTTASAHTLAMQPADRYRQAGVDLDTAERTKGRIRDAVASTYSSLTLGGFGGFGGMIRVPEDVSRPVLVMSTDGVGSKILVALQVGRYDTIGEDLVNHAVNDILVQGATPLAFQDYIAGAQLEPEIVVSMVEGVCRACRHHQISLLGGETAQLPDLYREGDYDLAGTIVGVVSEDTILTGSDVEVGDLLVAYESNGLHTNGYTLARRIVFGDMGLNVDSEMPDMNAPVGELLLSVHRSYWQALAPVLAQLHGLSHVTGGGIAANLRRVMPDGCRAVVECDKWPVPQLFRVLQAAGKVDEGEMFRVFNMGVGMIAAVPERNLATVRSAADRAGVTTWAVGRIEGGTGVDLVRDAR